MSSPELLTHTAMPLRQLMLERSVSAVEVVEAHLDAVERHNGTVNAIITLTGDRALATARDLDRSIARNVPAGPLHGLPFAHKDTAPTAGVRTTFGSPIYADYVPDTDALIVERLKNAGAISLGKTNVPEWAAGSQTTNPIFGSTRNPYDLDRTSGGSTGGGASALACRMIALADGNDMGGSLRNPASFCNVVGFRPSPGRVPSWPAESAWSSLAVDGPMARTVQDTALLLDAMAGYDSRSPIALPDPPQPYARSLERRFGGERICWSRNLGGLPVEREVVEVVDANRDVFSELGCLLEEHEPDMCGADEAFRAWRAFLFELGLGEEVDRHPELVGEKVRWNVDEARRLTIAELAEAERARTSLYHRTRELLTHYSFIVTPTVQVAPFDVTIPYPTTIDGVEQDTYLGWMRLCSSISILSLPAISVPAGFTRDGLPIGLQIVGRPQADLDVLQLAYGFERLTQYGQRLPPLLTA